jgi:hypothetical protein
VKTEHALRVRILLALAGLASGAVGAQLLVLGLSVFAFLPLGAPLAVLGFLGVCLGLALVAQGLMPWDTVALAEPAES